MKAKWFVVVLLVVAGSARAQAGELYDADVIDMETLKKK